MLTTRRLSPLTTATGLLSFVLVGASQAMYGPALPGLTQTFNLQPGAAGLMVSVHNAGAVLGVLSAVPLARLAVARWRVGASFALLGLGALLVGAAFSWPLTLAGGLVIGIAFGALVGSINGLFAVGYGRRSPAMVNLLNAIFGIGAILSPLLFLLDFDRWTGPFFVLAGITAVLLPFGLLMDDRLPVADNLQLPTQKKRGVVLAFMLLLGLGVAVEASTVGYATTYLIAVGVSLEQATTATSLFFLLFTFGRLAAIPLSLRLKPHQIVLGSLVLTGSLLLVANITSLAPVAVVLLGSSSAVYFPNCFNWANAVSGAGGSTPYIMAGTLLGGAFGPAIVAQIVPLVGEGAIMAIIGGISVLALLMGAWVKVRIAI
ncbi:MAG: MFS transporter [Candidatus Promineifilaceae bacterium]